MWRFSTLINKIQLRDRVFKCRRHHANHNSTANSCNVVDSESEQGFPLSILSASSENGYTN